MIDKWFNDDIQKILSIHNAAVFIDVAGNCEYLLDTLADGVAIHKTADEIEELHIKYLIEKSRGDGRKHIIYTKTRRDELRYIREYCEIYGTVEISKVENYVREKVLNDINKSISVSSESLQLAAKLSIGKDLDYWKDICHKGDSAIMDLKKELMVFLHSPTAAMDGGSDRQMLDHLFKTVYAMMDMTYVSKPAETIASEIVKFMFDGLARGSSTKFFDELYHNWLDSVSYGSSFRNYLNSYTLPGSIDHWNVSPCHPFKEIDKRWLADIANALHDKDLLASYLPKIKQRRQSKEAGTLNVCFWADVLTLIEFNAKKISELDSLDKCIFYYQNIFYKLDTAIRNLYAEFLNNKKLLEPFQQLYSDHLSVILDKWFRYWDSYQENQTGTLRKIINETDNSTAVIVGDGLSFELAVQIAEKINGYKLEKNIILADLPSETENNMSRIYIDSGITEPLHSKREKYLADNHTDINIQFINLDAVNDQIKPERFLVCTYKDFDSLGEKMQHNALKYFPEAVDFFAEKIGILLYSGYINVYLVSDHGFVLTGLLSESDKISVDISGECHKSERYIRTAERQPQLTQSYIEISKKYAQYNYIYLSKNINPFKSPGVYGFSHGGASPQELITPYFKWSNSSASEAGLTVNIQNKDDLVSVTGDYYTIKLYAPEDGADIFSYERKVILLFLSEGKQVNKSDIITIKAGEIIAKEYSFDKHNDLQVQLLDASTKKLLDIATVKQNISRDFGGLL